jgi:hypothetical protein
MITEVIGMKPRTSVRPFNLGLAILLLVVLAACSAVFTEPQPVVTPETEEPGAVYTAAVETVVAELTRIVGSETQALETGEVSFLDPTDTPIPAEPLPASPTPLPTDTPAPAPTETLLPTATPAQASTPTGPPAGDPRNTLGNPTWREDFETGARWALFSDDHTSLEVKDGQLEMVAFNPDFWNGWAFANTQAQDFYLEMTAVSQNCSGLDRYGLIFRAPAYNQGYLVGLSCDGQFSLWIWNSQTEIRLINWTPSSSILKGEGQANRLGVRAEGSTISLYANGVLLAELDDRTYTEGRFGVFVGAAATSNYTVEVSELSYWELP